MRILDDEAVLQRVRFSVELCESSIDDALDELAISPEQKERVRRTAEREVGLTVRVGPGIGGAETFRPWLAERDIEWFHWYRLKTLMSREGKLPIGAVVGLDTVSRRLLERMPPPDASDQWLWKGMVVGNVQSGKTATFTSLICKAADAGYRLFIVLSGMLNSLRLQTQLRLSREVLGDETVGGIAMPAGRKWHPLTSNAFDGDFGTVGGMGVDLLQAGQPPSLVVVKKNVPVMDALNEWIENIKLKHPEVINDLPVLIIDDESDEASIDTSKTTDPSSTNRELRRLIKVFKKRAYLGFTATPYANCFIPDKENHPHWEKDLYPEDYILPLDTSTSYTGGEKFFGTDVVWDGTPKSRVEGLLQEVPIAEKALLIPPSKEIDSFKPSITPCLRKAVFSFFLAGAARRYRGEGAEPCTMLIHISRFTEQHAGQKSIVVKFYNEVYQSLSMGNGRDRIIGEFEELWNNDFRPTIKRLDKTKDTEFPEIEKHLEEFVGQSRTLVVNQDSDDQIDFVREPGLKAIVIGGQSLGRGLTLEGLVTTFFMREPGNQSTAMQMQRWCGYRGSYLDLCRLYTTKEISDYYREFLAIEMEMRDELSKFETDKLSPVEVGVRLRQHPDIPLVSSAKKGAMREVSRGYAGKILQTTVFDMSDHSLLRSNVTALNELVKKAKSEVGDPEAPGDGNQVWNDVNASTVLDFLCSYEYPSHKGRSSFNSASIRSYIREKNAGKELTKWTVALCGIQKDTNGVMLGLDSVKQLNRVLRSRTKSNPNRLGIITEPKHEAIGLLDSINTGADARQDRPAGNGLLLIYPIKHPDETEESGPLPTIVGVAISFSSNLKDSKGIYVAGSVTLPEDEG